MIALGDFFDALRIADARFYDDEAQELNRLASGDVLRASLGATLWRGAITLAPAYHADAVAVEAALSMLKRGTPFMVYDSRKPGPRRDPDGWGLTGSTPVIASLEGNNVEMALSGMPPGYVLSPGDMLAFEYGSSPTRYALHRLVSGATADVAGLTGDFEVTPPIRPGAATSAAVTLYKPACKAILAPGARYGEARPVITEGASFEWIQVLR